MWHVQLFREEADSSAAPSTPLGLEGSVEAAAEFVRSHASLHTFMTDRIDRLRPSHQLTLKARVAQRPQIAILVQ